MTPSGILPKDSPKGASIVVSTRRSVISSHSWPDDVAAAYLAGAGYLSGYLALTEFAKFQTGQTVLAPAIGSAVGMETLQVARRLGASMTISTASTTQKAEQARAAGYEHVIDLSSESMKDGVLRITDGKGVDFVVDGVSGNLTGRHWPRSPSAAQSSSWVTRAAGKRTSASPTSSGRARRSGASPS